MNPTTHKSTDDTYKTCCPTTTMPFDSINEPGCYVCNWSGHLMRVPQDGVAPGRSPLLSFLGCDTLFVTKISGNPYIPVTKARMLAANWDVPVNF